MLISHVYLVSFFEENSLGSAGHFLLYPAFCNPCSTDLANASVFPKCFIKGNKPYLVTLYEKLLTNVLPASRCGLAFCSLRVLPLDATDRAVLVLDMNVSRRALLYSEAFYNDQKH